MKAISSGVPPLQAFVRLNSLQYLRAVAAVGVVLFHVEEGVNVYAGIEPRYAHFYWGHLGVPLFFVLSGFLVCYSAYFRPRPAREFLYGRLIRIYPVYLFLVLAFIGCILFLPAGMFRGSHELNLTTLLRTLFFDFGRMGGYIYVAWTLFYELVFYVGFCFLVSRFPRIAASRMFYVCAGIGLVAVLVIGNTRIADFLLGVLIFLLLVNPKRQPLASPAMIFLGFAACFAWYSSAKSVFCMALVLGLCLLEQVYPRLFNNRLLLKIGDGSYSIYLVQVFTISACLKAAQPLASHIGSGNLHRPAFLSLSVLFAVLATCCAGLLIHELIEKPSIHFLNKPRRMGLLRHESQDSQTS